MNSEQELAQSDEDLSKGYFGNFWDFRMSDDEWREASLFLSCKFNKSVCVLRVATYTNVEAPGNEKETVRSRTSNKHV